MNSFVEKCRELDALFRTARKLNGDGSTLHALFEREAVALGEAQRAGRRAASIVILNALHEKPGWFAGSSADEIDARVLADELDIDAARRAIARWHGFADWTAVTAADRTIDEEFESACDAILDGDEDTLRALVSGRPALVQARSPFPHRSTLLHYVAANGIENHRQWQAPQNAARVAEILLAAGADPNATCTCYGERDTVLGLLLGSAPPAQAGVTADVVEALCKGGAKVDGPEDDGAPLWAAITTGSADSIERLARSGARVDNLVFAATLGDLALVRGYFDDAGQLRPERAPSGEQIGLGGPALDATKMLEYALIFACGNGQSEVVEFLLTKKPDLSVHEPLWNSTALGKAYYHQRREIAERLRPLVERS
ncbi:MAG TPA: hypothetical protein VGM44_14140 [Polyangiaceae bacterium]